jgi:hypothetical protein
MREKSPKKDSPELDQEQKRAAAFLAMNGWTPGVRAKSKVIQRTASLFNRGTSTIHRWLKLPKFLQLIEARQAKIDELADEGLRTCLGGIPEKGILPNITGIIWWKKIRNPAVFDDQFRRDAAKRKHEKEMAALRINPPDEEPRQVPQFNFRMTGPGERIVVGSDPEDEDTH